MPRFHSAFLLLAVAVAALLPGQSRSISLSQDMDEVVIVKVGGSSITDKSQRETLNEQNIQWFAETLAISIAQDFKSTSSFEESKKCKDDSTTKRAFVIIHGAGSFGHHHAKQYGLSGKTVPASKEEEEDQEADTRGRRFQMEGLAKTRLSVQTLNRILLESLIHHGINAVGISPCFAAPSMRANGSSPAAADELRAVVEASLVAGLVPVIHGDACLYGTHTAGILSGDTLFSILGLAPWASRGVFLTDVDGVHTADPRVDPNASLIQAIGVKGESGELLMDQTIAASESLHPHDVTGGFRTKLTAALQVVEESGRNVTIARCGSSSAALALQGQEDDQSTVIFRVT